MYVSHSGVSISLSLSMMLLLVVLFLLNYFPVGGNAPWENTAGHENQEMICNLHGPCGHFGSGTLAGKHKNHILRHSWTHTL